MVSPDPQAGEPGDTVHLALPFDPSTMVNVGCYDPVGITVQEMRACQSSLPHHIKVVGVSPAS